VRAVIATHLYGRTAAMPAILKAAAGTPVIEDCAQAHGACLDGRPAGTWGALGCFSFYPTKNLGALGDGGAVVTSDAGLAARVRGLGQYGWSGKYRSALAGGRNSRLDEIQAAVLRVKLPRLAGWNRRRLKIAGDYNRALAECALITPAMSEAWVAHLYVVRCQNRDGLREALRARGIGTDVHYPIPDHLQESSQWKGHLPVTVTCCLAVLSLPCFPELTDDEVALVAEATCATASESLS
jgi:dTDP-3-amino-2,3,6-trideoxy-4-keto-D-glucose/dTDP-3-amino-3,4,6-trideoxy-alpha-D-glucose/dTDP-2,6-dideoxy-D-kanosamine transaminase